LREMRFWYGYARDRPGLFQPWVRELWDRAQSGDWQKVFSSLPVDGEHSVRPSSPYVNAICPFHETNYSFLHLAAQQGAGTEVVEHLLAMGAWRSLQDARGQRAIEVARKHDRSGLYELLKPRFRREVPFAVLLEIQHRFHSVIRGWHAGPRLDSHEMMLPQLQPMLEVERVEFRFDIAHWYGGFNYELVAEGDDARLECFGASRVIGGSGGKVEITRHGVKRIPLEGVSPP
jgi:hypothetical protein